METSCSPAFALHLEDQILKNLSQLKSALLTILALSFIVTFSAGCDDSGDNLESFVINQPFEVGNLVFNLQPESLAEVGFDTVPDETSTVRIDVFSTNPPSGDSLLLTETLALGDTINLSDVSITAESVLITAFDENNLPLGTLFSDLDFFTGETATIDLNDFVPSTFNSAVVSPDVIDLEIDIFAFVLTDEQQVSASGDISGDTFDLPINANSTSFIVADPSLIEVSPTGLISTDFGDEDVLGGSTEVTATYTFQDTQISDTFTVNIRNFSVVNSALSIIAQGGIYDEGFGVAFVDNTGTQQSVSDQVVFALQNPIQGVSITDDGVIQVSEDTPVGDFNVVATFADTESGITFSRVIPFTVISSLDV